MNRAPEQWEVSYTNDLSKRTSVYAGYVQINHESRNNVAFNINPFPVANGAKPQGYLLGMSHNF